MAVSLPLLGAQRLGPAVHSARPARPVPRPTPDRPIPPSLDSLSFLCCGGDRLPVEARLSVRCVHPQSTGCSTRRRSLARECQRCLPRRRSRHQQHHQHPRVQRRRRYPCRSDCRCSGCPLARQALGAGRRARACLSAADARVLSTLAAGVRRRLLWPDEEREGLGLGGGVKVAGREANEIVRRNMPLRKEHGGSMNEQMSI